MIKGVQVHGSSKKKKKASAPTQSDMKRMETEWRQYNKRMRQSHNHKAQFDTLEDYIAYTKGQYKPKRKKSEFKEYKPSGTYTRETKHYPSLSAMASPNSCAKKESMQYTGDLIVGIGTMHKSNAIPIMRDTDQAKEIATMRRN